MSATTNLSARNCANASHSTGPRTEQGKARSSKNSLKHGIFCAEPVLPGEDPAPYREFRRGMLLSLNPRTLFELELAQQIVADQWRIRRIRDAEVDLYQQRIESRKEQHEKKQSFEHKKDRKPFETPGAGSLTNGLMRDKDSELERFQKYEQRCLGSYQRCIKLLREFQRSSPVEPGIFIQQVLEQEDAADEPVLQNEAKEEKDEEGRMKDESKNDPNQPSIPIIHPSETPTSSPIDNDFVKTIPDSHRRPREAA